MRRFVASINTCRPGSWPIVRKVSRLSISDRLGRLLFIVPYVAHRDGVPLSELAEKLNVSEAQLQDDIELLSMVGQPPLTPDHLIDLYIEDDVVYVELDQSLSRPLTLTHEEARALVLGAKLVSSLGGLGNELEAVLQKIMIVLNPVDRTMMEALTGRIGIWQDSSESPAPAKELRYAVEHHQQVNIDYYSLSSDQTKHYVLQPLALISHSGVEYLVAYDLGAESQEKLFRLDRVAHAQQTGVTFAAPKDLDLERFRTRRLYMGHDTTEVVVWFDAKVASLVRERFSDEEIREQPEGSVLVHITTSSPAWLARWVLPFAQNAEVLQPAAPRNFIKDLCDKAYAAYRRPLT